MSFRTDLKYSEQMKILLEDFYKKSAFQGRFVYVAKGNKYKSIGSDQIQKQFMVDTVVQISNEESVLVEEKFRRKEWPDIIIETASCTVPGKEKPGWIYNSSADFLVYVFDCNDKLKIFVMNMNRLKNFYFYNKDKYVSKKTWQINRTEFIVVPLNDIDTMVGYKYYEINKPK